MLKKMMTVGAALLLTTSMAQAVGLDRSGQPIGIIFQDGNYAELSFGYVRPTIDGTDAAPFPSSDTDNVAKDYSILGLGYKADIDDQYSFAIIIDEPYGADISYPTGASLALGGTEATLDSVAVTGLLRYKIDNNISLYGGLRAQSTEGEITLNGLAYGALAGYDVELERHTGYGYTIGGAYERPEIALRVALTYTSEIKHEFETTDTFGSTADTEVTTPQAINLDFQTGVAADTIVFGSIRWAEYSVVKVEPENFPAGSLTDIEDGFGYSFGVGRRFNEQFSGSVSVGYEPEGEDSLVSPLSPTNGNYSVALGGEYTVDKVTFSGGIRYIILGDASSATADTARADFADNSALAVGMKIGYSF
jgi:long-subunit fatty acid transport protein